MVRIIGKDFIEKVYGVRYNAKRKCVEIRLCFFGRNNVVNPVYTGKRRGKNREGEKVKNGNER